MLFTVRVVAQINRHATNAQMRIAEKEAATTLLHTKTAMPIVNSA